MSKDIWHKADEAPRYRFQCVYYHRDSKEYYFGEYDATFRVFLGKKTFQQSEVGEFAFAEDIMSCLDELERTRKALEIAKNAINSAVDHNIINCVARGIDPRTEDTNVTLCNALEQITALEQKEEKWN